VTGTKQRRHRPPGYGYASAAQCGAELIADFRQVVDRKAWPLYIHGTTGVGKSCAAAVLFGAYRQRPLWFRADDLLLSMAFGRANGVRVERCDNGQLSFETVDWPRFARKMRNVNCVFLDDLGVRKPTEAMHQALFDLMEWRQDDSPLPFVITSNQPPEEIGKTYDDRIYSRLMAGSVIEMTGADQREGRGYRKRVSV